MADCVDRLERIERSISLLRDTTKELADPVVNRAIEVLAVEARRCTRADAVLSHVRGVLATGGPHCAADAAALDTQIESILGPLPRADQAAKPR